ncbi:MAG: hypothetical protein AB9869_29275 [Verrucomicrobiia bacterium]
MSTFPIYCTAVLFIGLARLNAAAYPEPAGGWTYLYQGDQLQVGEENTGWTSMDGTWTHDNNSDAWDGTGIGGDFGAGGGAFGVNSPGGASLGTQDGVSYLRMQDTGDPRDYGYNDPSSRKVYFGHDIGTDIDPDKALTIMDDGVTLTFRARIPTLAKAGGPLDSLHRDGQQSAGIQPYPEDGDGYVTSDGGKGNFVIRQGGNGAGVPAGAIAFSFTQTTDTTGGSPTTGRAGFAGLTFNEFNGNVPTDQVNFGQGTKTNVVAFDPTDWHEVYIVIRKDPANIGTHDAFIFLDGNVRPSVFKMTAGTGADMENSFLAMGGSATPQNWALDVDWFGYKDAAVFPAGAELPPSLFDLVPANQALFHPAAQGIRFAASSQMPANRLPSAGFKMTLNGQDVSSQLALTGSDTSASRTATFSGLQPNSIYAATYVVTDSGGLSSTNEITFDTFIESQTTIIEAEDYNHSGGQFIDGGAPGAYASLEGAATIDFVDASPSTLGAAYRSSDAVDLAETADVARKAFTDAAVSDYQIGGIVTGEWWNYTRTIPAGNYRAYVRAASTSAQQLRLDRVTAGATQASQTVQFLGSFSVPRTGNLNLFDHIPLTDVQGRLVALPLSGQTTLRLTAVGASDDLVLNYLLLVPADTAAAEPLVSALPAAGSLGVSADASVEVAIFDGSSPVDQASVKLRLNGAEVAATVAKSGSLTAVKYSPAALWKPATSYALNLAFNDGTARSIDWTFTTANYPVLTPGMKVTDARTPGFVWRMHQNEANQDTTVQKAENALAGRLLDGTGQPLPNLADADVLGPAAASGQPRSPGGGTMTFRIPTVINVSQTADTASGFFVPDEQMPGIPGVNGSTDGIAVGILTFIDLPAGYNTMGVNSDDGFRTTAGYLNGTPLELAQVDGGRSAGDTLFQLAVEEAGVYAFRTIYFEGGGDAAIEWFTVNPDGTRTLVNDTATGGRRAFQEGTIPEQPVNGDITLSVRRDSANVVIEWTAGTLQSADSVTGTFQDVAGAQSPWSVAPTGAQKFYRVRGQ